ncbi:MAG TPA: glutathione transferase GstA [Steroidobacteraceae bacterium]|nr:glutathione transferase GstA [Steroidobacteraceae bacterium]
MSLTLYYMPGACSLAPHIALRESGLPFDTLRVDGKSKTTADGQDYLRVSSKGYVPALRLVDGSVLTECVAILLYVGDHSPDGKLAARTGMSSRYRVLEWLAYIGTEVHKAYGPMFTPTATDAEKQRALDNLGKKFTWVQNELGDRPFLLGDAFTVADAHLFTTLNWTGFIGLDLGSWPGLKNYHARIGSRPQVIATLKTEGLIKS